MTADTQGYQQPDSFGAPYNAHRFTVNSLIALIRTGTPCQVVKVTNNGEVSPVGYVDLQPLVNQVSGSGLSQSEGIITGIPYFRLQGGLNAIIADPKVGDKGYCCFADKDTSSVKKNKVQSNPGSARKFDVSDGWFFPGFINGAPTQYWRFYDGGIDIKSTGKFTVTDGAGSVIVMNGDGTGTMTFASGLTINANIQVNGAVVATGEGTFNGGHTVSQHTHTQGNDSHGDTEVPTNKPNG